MPGTQSSLSEAETGGQQMKKKIVWLLALSFIVAAALCGCQSNQEKAGADLSKAEWVGLLGDKFGYDAYESTTDFYSDVSADDDCYNAIQACAEWEILTETGAFHPKDAATWRYAIETSVRAIGIDKLKYSGAEVAENDLVDFFTKNIAVVGDASLDRGISAADASLILGYAYQYASGLALPEQMTYTYNDNVRAVSGDSILLKGDGATAVISDGASYKAGDIIYVEASENNVPYAVRVTSADQGEITYEAAAMEDVYEEFQVRGTYEAAVLNVEPAEGVNITLAGDFPNISFAYASYTPESDAGMSVHPGNPVLTGFSRNGSNIKFSAGLEDGTSLEVSISDVRVTADVDFGIFTGLKKADAALVFKDSVTVSHRNEHTSRQIPLGMVELALGTTPLTVRFTLVANLGLNGEVTLTYSSRVAANVNYKKGNGLGKSVSSENVQYDFHAKATLTVEPCVKAELCCLGRGLANVKVTSGIVALATVDTDLLGNEPECTDIYMYVPLRWAVNEDSCVMTAISSKLQASGVVWSSENSLFNNHFHWEDNVLVEACTRGKKKVETDIVDDEGMPYDEYTLFAFEDIVFGFIRVSSTSLYLSDGESLAVGILSVPEGYSMADLVYQTEDPSVCTAAGGMVTAAGSGSTLLEIATSDGKYKVYLTVTVETQYHDTSGFQPL